MLIRWDLSSLPQSISITSAVMELKCNAIYGSTSGQMVYYLFTGDWDETKVTCATLHDYTNKDFVITNWPSAGQWHTVDITRFAQKWIENPASNHGLYGHSAGTISQCCAEFNSSDALTNTMRPRLTITFTKTTEVQPPNQSQPFWFHLAQNYPNPFNPVTLISFSITKTDRVVLDVYSVSGRKIHSLVNENKTAGSYSIVWDGCDDSGRSVSSGMYLYKLQVGSMTQMKKMALIK